MKKEKITYANQLYMYPLFLNEDGKAIRLKESIIQPLLLTHELLNEKNEIGNIALQKCLEQMQRLAGNTDEQWKPMRYGIVSLFQQMQVEDGEIPKIGMLTFIQIDNEVVNWLDYVHNIYCILNIVNDFLHWLVCHWTFINSALIY